jgi:hypothetical protein
MKIEPPHRRALVEVLRNATFVGRPAISDWVAPAGSFQTTANAVYTADLASGQLIKCWLQLPTLNAPSIRVIGDAYIDPPNDTALEWPLSLEGLVRFWADLLTVVGTSIGQSVLQLLAVPPPAPTTIELHVEARSQPSTTLLDKCLDLSPLGSPTRQPPLQGMWAGSASLLETRASIEVALDALRDNALDWGYLDPDPGIDSIRRTVSQA